MAFSGNRAGQGDIGTFAPLHNRGSAVFINNIKPKGNDGKFEFTPREDGGPEDSTSLQTVFITTLGFKWINSDCYRDLTTQQWDHRKKDDTPGAISENCGCIRCKIRYMDHSQSKYFVLAISSHGREITETEIIFSDGNSIYLSEILEALNDSNCPTLTGKTRIIIINTCRGMYKDKDRVMSMQDRGVPVPVQLPNVSGSMEATGQGDAINTNDDPSVTKGRFKVESVEDHTLQDFAISKLPQHYLLVYSAVSGQKAKRSEKDGSWLLHGMKKILQDRYVSSGQLLKPLNFLQFLTEVSDYIARERESIIYKERKKNQSEDGNQGNHSENGNQENQSENGNQENQSENGNRENQPENVNQENQPENGNQENQPENGNQENQSENGNQENQPENGNQENQSENGNQENQSENGNQENPSKNGNQENQSENGNQENQSENGNQENQSENGNQENQSEDGNQENQSENGYQENQSENGNQENQPENGNQENQSENGNQENQSENGNQENQSKNGNQENQPENGNQENQSENGNQENQSENGNQENQNQNEENQPADVEQNQSDNAQKVKKSKSKRDWVRDEEKSGFKSCIILHHRLVEPIVFYPEQKEPELPETATFSFGTK